MGQLAKGESDYCGSYYQHKRFTHQQATSAIVVSYYWHFVDVVWIGLFTMIYLVK